MPNDRQSRPTLPPTPPPASGGARPPPLPRGEDSPPGQYRAVPPRVASEPIARIALRAPPAGPPPAESELLRALAQTEGKMLAMLGEHRQEFETQMREELRALVVHEVQSVPPPPSEPPKKKPNFEWAHLQYLGGLLVALTGLIAVLQSCGKPSAEIIRRLDSSDKKLTDVSEKLDTHLSDDKQYRVSNRDYELAERSWITDVLERAASVKIDDPPGTPPRSQLLFYPSPLVDPHRVTKTPIVQPRDPYPVPPAP